MKKDVNIFVVANHKGGVGKSFSTYFLAHLFATNNHKKVKIYDYQREAENTLVIDLDFQSDLSKAILKENYKDIDGGVLEAISEQDARPYIIQSKEFKHFYLLPGTSDVAQFDDIFSSSLASLKDPFRLLETAIGDAVEELDIKNIVIDTSPSLNKMNLMALSISFGRPTNVLIPFQLDQFGSNSINNITKTLEAVKEKTNENLNVLGLLPVLIDGTSKRDKKYLEEVRNVYGDLVFDVEIMRKTEIKNILESGFSEKYAHERGALTMYHKLFKNVKERM